MADLVTSSTPSVNPNAFRSSRFTDGVVIRAQRCCDNGNTVQAPLRQAWMALSDLR